MSECSYIHMSANLSANRPREFPSNLPNEGHVHVTDVADRRRQLLAEPSVATIAETFRVLGDPTRIRILDALAAGELCVCDIASIVGMSESAVSHQLRLLRSMRLVRTRRAGRQIFYTLDDRHILQLLRLAATHVEERQA
jgi:ArsR family transcriptional regulator, lead/cadmium/zinc/bismuth-responsive transcriptional repressor